MLLQDEALLTRIERFIWLLFFLLSAASLFCSPSSSLPECFLGFSPGGR